MQFLTACIISLSTASYPTLPVSILPNPMQILLQILTLALTPLVNLMLIVTLSTPSYSVLFDSMQLCKHYVILYSTYMYMHTRLDNT